MGSSRRHDIATDEGEPDEVLELSALLAAMLLGAVLVAIAT